MFDHAYVGPTHLFGWYRSGRRPTIQDITITESRCRNVEVCGALIRRVVVDGLICPDGARSAPVFLWGNAYVNVALRGSIPATKIAPLTPLTFGGQSGARLAAEIERQNHEVYAATDWALDISAASFSSFEIFGVPSTLVRRDAERTALVRRSKVLDQRWRRQPYRWGGFQFSIEAMLDYQLDEVILVAGDRSKRFRDELEDLRVLRDAGIAE